MPPFPRRPAAAYAVAALFPPLMLSAAPLRAQAPAQQTPPPAPASQDLDPASPMAPLPDLGLPWPEIAPADQPVAGQPTAAAPSDTARPYRFELTGADALPEFRTRFDPLSELRAGESKAANAAQIEGRAHDDQDLAREILRAVGRYDGTASVAVTNPPGGGPVAVTLAVEPGDLYTFSGVAIPGLDRAGARAPELRQKFSVKAGDPIDADRVNLAVATFRTDLGNSGYPFAKVDDPNVTIDHATRAGSLLLPVVLGDQARFGRIKVTGTRPIFSAHHVADIARFDPGDPYETRMLDDLRRALIQTSLVSVATVTPEKTDDPGVVDIGVHLERAPPHTIAGALGYGTGEGARAEVSWQHRNLIQPEGAVTFRAVAGTREQSVSSLLRMNNFHARDRVLTGQIAAAHTNFDAYDARTFTISAGLERQSNIIYQKKWTWSGGTEFVASDERDTIEATGQPRRRTFLVAALPGSLGYDASDDLLNPTRGWRLLGRVSPELSLQDGTRGYVKVQLDASAYLPMFNRTVIAGRVRVAAITGTARDNIAPSRRLYAGGGGSVRGYGYQKIGPVDVNGDPVGGRGLAEAAIEARIRFGNFGVVPFLDAGNLYADPAPKFTNLRFGTGLGARYYSSFGPIRIDVGTPLSRRKGESRVAVYVSLGQAF
jgi:translocation and assembly module TamA